MGEHQREVALEPAQHREHRRDEVARGRALPVGAGDQVHRDLGVGVAGELHPVGFQFMAQRREVLDDAVVHDRELAGGVAMRVGVAVGGPAVGGPAGVPDPGGTGQRGGVGLGQRRLQVGQPARATAHRQPAVTVEDRDARGVVAAVFHPAQCVDHDLTGRAMPDVSHDSAHGYPG